MTRFGRTPQRYVIRDVRTIARKPFTYGFRVSRKGVPLDQAQIVSYHRIETRSRRAVGCQTDCREVRVIDRSFVLDLPEGRWETGVAPPTHNAFGLRTGRANESGTIGWARSERIDTEVGWRSVSGAHGP